MTAGKGKNGSPLAVVQNEEGTILAAALILLIVVSLFLFTLVSWHSNLYRTFDSIETYYVNETTKIMGQGG
ncbi:hypothetical protein SLU01_27090 [Sporosarcina luteola]|uniref:Uncharacterized protein n=1 Tax=Sporosarcina luteola TaxID=582850 RepID=A0A511ZAB7_9BACL|nr:hypothetical protein SLU01_27090 [Sporosarcina luteola]